MATHSKNAVVIMEVSLHAWKQETSLYNVQHLVERLFPVILPY